MTPDDINKSAIWGILAMAVIAAAVFLADWASGDDSSPVLVAGQTLQTLAGDGSEATTQQPTTSFIATAEPNDPGPAITTTSLLPTTTGTASTTTRPATTTTVPSATSSTSTSTTLLTSTTTTMAATTTTTIRPTTTTTTTKIPTTTTTTTTTTIPRPGVLVHKFEGHDHGDPGAWEPHIKIEIRDENDAQVPFPLVTVS